MTASLQVEVINSPRLPVLERRPDLDWIRVIAFGVLIFFHAAVAFMPHAIPMTVNAVPSPTMMAFVAFLHQFRLSLLFLVSGMGICFALRRRSTREFLLNRMHRLVVPLIFGVLVLVPPMVWMEKRYAGQFQGSLLDLYFELFTHGVYPHGYLSWHHFWFVAYLFLMCGLLVPIVNWLRTPNGERLFSYWLAKMVPGAAIYWMILPLVVVELLLRVWFPGFRDLLHDWASFSHWFLVLLAGYGLASHAPLFDRIKALVWISVVLACSCSVLMFQLFYDPSTGDLAPMQSSLPLWLGYLIYCVLGMTNVWCWVLACTGLALRFLTRGGPILNYLNDAVYPLFCLHLPVMVAWETVLLPLDWPVLIKYCALTGATLVTTLLFHHVVVRHSAFLSRMLGRQFEPRRETRVAAPGRTNQ